MVVLWALNGVLSIWICARSFLALLMLCSGPKPRRGVWRNGLNAAVTSVLAIFFAALSWAAASFLTATGAGMESFSTEKIKLLLVMGGSLTMCSVCNVSLLWLELAKTNRREIGNMQATKRHFCITIIIPTGLALYGCFRTERFNFFARTACAIGLLAALFSTVIGSTLLCDRVELTASFSQMEVSCSKMKGVERKGTTAPPPTGRLEVSAAAPSDSAGHAAVKANEPCNRLTPEQCGKSSRCKTAAARHQLDSSNPVERGSGQQSSSANTLDPILVATSSTKRDCCMVSSGQPSSSSANRRVLPKLVYQCDSYEVHGVAENKDALSQKQAACDANSSSRFVLPLSLSMVEEEDKKSDDLLESWASSAVGHKQKHSSMFNKRPPPLMIGKKMSNRSTPSHKQRSSPSNLWPLPFSPQPDAIHNVNQYLEHHRRRSRLHGNSEIFDTLMVVNSMVQLSPYAMAMNHNKKFSFSCASPLSDHEKESIISQNRGVQAQSKTFRQNKNPTIDPSSATNGGNRTRARPRAPRWAPSSCRLPLLSRFVAQKRTSPVAHKVMRCARPLAACQAVVLLALAAERVAAAAAGGGGGGGAPLWLWPLCGLAAPVGAQLCLLRYAQPRLPALRGGLAGAFLARAARRRRRRPAAGGRQRSSEGRPRPRAYLAGAAAARGSLTKRGVVFRSKPKKRVVHFLETTRTNDAETARTIGGGTTRR